MPEPRKLLTCGLQLHMQRSQQHLSQRLDQLEGNSKDLQALSGLAKGGLVVLEQLALRVDGLKAHAVQELESVRDSLARAKVERAEERQSFMEELGRIRTAMADERRSCNEALDRLKLRGEQEKTALREELERQRQRAAEDKRSLWNELELLKADRAREQQRRRPEEVPREDPESAVQEALEALKPSPRVPALGKLGVGSPRVPALGKLRLTPRGGRPGAESAAYSALTPRRRDVGRRAALEQSLTPRGGLERSMSLSPDEAKVIWEGLRALQDQVSKVEASGLERSKALCQGLAWMKSKGTSLQASLREELSELQSDFGWRYQSLREDLDCLKVKGEKEQQDVEALGVGLCRDVDRLKSLLTLEASFDLREIDFSEYAKGDCWDSRPFSLGGVNGFFLSFFPLGDSRAEEGRCSIYLCHEVEGLEAKFHLSLDGETMREEEFVALDPGSGFDPTAKGAFTSAKVRLLEVKHPVLKQ